MENLEITTWRKDKQNIPNMQEIEEIKNPGTHVSGLSK
jgi:hypothetical protein